LEWPNIIGIMIWKSWWCFLGWKIENGQGIVGFGMNIVVSTFMKAELWAVEISMLMLFQEGRGWAQFFLLFLIRFCGVCRSGLGDVYVAQLEAYWKLGGYFELSVLWCVHGADFLANVSLWLHLGLHVVQVPPTGLIPFT
jgi:hypothetical protein